MKLMHSGVKTLVGIAIAAIVSPAIGEQQQSQERRLVPITVCEVLAAPQQFDGKDVAVLGRFDSTEEGRWLSEDNCGRRLVTEGFTWPNRIWLDCCHQPAPDPPSGALLLDEVALSGKLKQVRQTTQLHFVTRWEGTGVVRDGKAKNLSYEPRVVREDWGVAYGRLETRKEFRVVRGGDGQFRGFGFGHLAAAPMQLIIKQQHVRTISESETENTKQK